MVVIAKMNLADMTACLFLITVCRKMARVGVILLQTKVVATDGIN